MLLHLVVPGDLGRWEQCQQLCMFSRSFVCLGWWNGSSFVVCCVYVEYSVCIAYHMYKYIYICEDGRMEPSILNKSGYFAVKIRPRFSHALDLLLLGSTAKAMKKQLWCENVLNRKGSFNTKGTRFLLKCSRLWSWLLESLPPLVFLGVGA